MTWKTEILPKQIKRCTCAIGKVKISLLSRRANNDVGTRHQAAFLVNDKKLVKNFAYGTHLKSAKKWALEHAEKLNNVDN